LYFSTVVTQKRTIVPKIVGYHTTIQLRVRVHPSKGDPRNQFMSKGTLMAILIHEIAHLKHMNHGKDFMNFLKTLYGISIIPTP